MEAEEQDSVMGDLERLMLHYMLLEDWPVGGESVSFFVRGLLNFLPLRFLFNGCTVSKVGDVTFYMLGRRGWLFRGVRGGGGDVNCTIGRGEAERESDIQLERWQSMSFGFSAARRPQPTHPLASLTVYNKLEVLW